jgi:nucleotide-binding universal stress UspA family protein
MLVGVDWSAESFQALDWAAAEAAARGSRLTVCHVLRHEPADVPLPDQVLHQILDRGQALLDDAVDRVRSVDQALPVADRLECGRVAESLVELARAAEEVVLGGRGVGGFYRLRLGSVAVQVATHAVCPVTVVRGERGTEGVVIGVDGSESGRAALDHGFRYASQHGLTVQALHVYPPPMPLPRMGYPPAPVDHRESALHLVTDSLRPWAAKFPDVIVEPTVVAGHPASVLAEASRGSTLLVVGSRGRDGFAEVLLGSVSQALLRHAHCPVTIAR